jgi:Ala-tRNA(Pro) deacylase
MHYFLTVFLKFKLSIHHTTYRHEPVFIVEQALQLTATIPGASCKNLFLKDSKNRFYLVVAVHDTVINLKKLSKHIHAPELRFANADLLKHYLGVYDIYGGQHLLMQYDIPGKN